VLDREEASLDPVLDQACRLVRQTGWWQQGLPWCPSSTSVVLHLHGFATIIFGGRLFATRLYNFASLSAIVEVDAMKGIIDCFIFDRRGLPW